MQENNPPLLETTLKEAIKKLGSSDATERNLAYNQLLESGSNAIPFLQEAMKNKKLRIPATKLLGDLRVKDEASIATLLKGLADRNKDFRLAVRQSLLSLDPREVSRVCGSYLIEEKKDKKHKIEIIRLLAALGEPSAIIPLLTLARSDKSLLDESMQAVQRISGISRTETLVQLFQQALAGDMTVLPTLIESGEQIRQILALGPSSTDPTIRRLSLHILSEERDPSISLILKGFTDPDPATRAISVKAASRLKTPEVLDRLVELLGDPDLRVRNVAVMGLSQPIAVDRLLGALKSKNKEIRANAIKSLARIQPEEIHEHIASFIEEENNKEIKEEALRLLEIIGTPEDLPSILLLLENGDPLHEVAFAIIHRIARRHQFQQNLEFLLKIRDPNTAQTGIEGLTASLENHIISRILEKWAPNSKISSVRRASIDILGRTTFKSYKNLFEEFLTNDQSEEVRAAAALSLSLPNHRTDSLFPLPLSGVKL